MLSLGLAVDGDGAAAVAPRGVEHRDHHGWDRGVQLFEPAQARVREKCRTALGGTGQRLSLRLEQLGRTARLLGPLEGIGADLLGGVLLRVDGLGARRRAAETPSDDRDLG